MGLVNNLIQIAEGSILSLILMIFVVVLGIIFIFLLVRELVFFVSKLKKGYEASEIIALKRKERQLLTKLKKDRTDINQKIGRLKTSSEKSSVKRKTRKKRK